MTKTLPDASAPPMQQHAAYGRACALLGAKVLNVVAGDPADPAAAAQILIRRWPLFGPFALLARGPVWFQDVSPDLASAATRDLMTMLRAEFRGVVATGEPLPDFGDPLADKGLLPLFTPGTRAVLPLAGSANTRLARQHGKWRNRLRRAQNGGLSVVNTPMPADAGHWLLGLETAQARERGYKRLSADFTRAWRAANGSDSARLFVARLGDDPVAAMLFLLHGTSASYHIGWSGEEGRKAHAHNLLLWEASNWLADRGYTQLDLGTLDTESTAGLARFKLGSGARPFRLGATWLDAPGAALVARTISPKGSKRGQQKVCCSSPL